MLELKIEAPSLDRMVRRYNQAPAIVGEELRAATFAATRRLRDEVRERTPVRSGLLRSSIRASVTGKGREVSGTVAVVGRARRYAGFVERGTRPHLILPRQGKALRWFVGGTARFATRVQHPGSKGRFMLSRGAAAAQPVIIRIYAGHLGNVTRRLSSGN